MLSFRALQPADDMPTMITLYHCVNARSFRVLWTLEELGLPCELHVLPFPPHVHRKDYKALNPLGTIPLFLDGPVRMTESVAICQYLVSRYGPSDLEVASAESDFGAYLNWLHFGEATLTFPQTLVLRYSRLEPEARRQPQVVEDYTRWFLARLRAVDAAVADQASLCARRFTIADIAVGYALLLASDLGLGEHFSAGMQDYWQGLQAREPFQRALERQRQAAQEQGVSPEPIPVAAY